MLRENHHAFTNLIDGMQLILLSYNRVSTRDWCKITIAKKWCHSHVTDKSLRWRHNWRDNVSNHQPQDCLLNRLCRRRSKKTSKLRVTGLCVGPVNSPHKWPVTRKMFPFDDVIMCDILFMRWITDKYTFRQQHTSKNRHQCNVAKLILISNSEKLIIKWLWIIIFICMLKNIMNYKEGDSVRGFKHFYL